MSLKNKPLVTLALFTYNQELFAADAVDSMLNQDYSNLEIILSDDCSTDSTFEIMEKLSRSYTGNSRIVLNRNQENLGLAAHFNKVLSMAKGEIIIVAAGDDVSLKDRVSKTVEIFETHPEVVIVSFDDHQIDDEGALVRENLCAESSKSTFVGIQDLLSRKSIKLSGASRGIRRSLYDDFGNLKENCPTEDTPYLLRGLMTGKGYSCSLPGIYYRRHNKSLSSASSIHNMNFEVITEQYFSDASVARKSGVITQKTFNEIIKWSDTTLKLRYIRKKIYERKLLFNEFLREILMSKDFNVKDKIALSKSIVKSYFEV